MDLGHHPVAALSPARRRRAPWRLRVPALLALILLPSAGGASERWRFDPTHSAIGFELAALGIVPIGGRFDRFAGEAWRDPVDGLLRVAIRIEAGSLAMRPERYADWARSPEFFHVREHPVIEFRSGPIPDGLLGAGGEISGQLRMRGVERATRFEVAPNDCQPGVEACTLEASGEINRHQFGMRSRRVALSSRVRLNLRLHTLRVPVPPLQAQPPSAQEKSEQPPGSKAVAIAVAVVLDQHPSGRSQVGGNGGADAAAVDDEAEPARTQPAIRP